MGAGRAVRPGRHRGDEGRPEPRPPGKRRRLFEEVAREHEKSAYGKLAKDWLKNYEDAGGRQDLAGFYQEMQASLRVPEAARRGSRAWAKGWTWTSSPGSNRPAAANHRAASAYRPAPAALAFERATRNDEG